MITFFEVARTAKGKWVAIDDEQSVETEEFLKNVLQRVTDYVYLYNITRSDELTGEAYTEEAYVKVIG